MTRGSAHRTLGQAGLPLCSSQSKLGLARGPRDAALSILVPFALLNTYHLPGWEQGRREGTARHLSSRARSPEWGAPSYRDSWTSQSHLPGPGVGTPAGGPRGEGGTSGTELEAGSSLVCLYSRGCRLGAAEPEAGGARARGER